MKFTLEGTTGANQIRAYSAVSVQVGERVVRSSCIVMADALVTDWPVATFADLTVAHLEPVFALRPELVLLGTGATLRFAPADVRAAFLTQRIGVEAMDLGAACRTFNILVQEERRVAAVLFFG